MMKFKALTGFTSVILLLIASAIGPREAAAQAGTGQIKGVVTDPSGAVVPGAVVTAISIDNGFTRTTISGADGSFLIPSLDPQHYKLQIVAPTFEKLVRGPITVQVTETADIGHAALSIGEQTQTITVDAAEALIDTEDATLGKVFDSTLIEGLPLATRNFSQLVGLQAGVIGDIPHALSLGNATSNFAVGGNRQYDNSFNMDGVNSLSSSGSNNFSIPSPDALEEFKVQTSNYSAEYGRAGGASIDITTKSGTNQFHGDAFEFYRDRNLNANSYFEKQNEANAGTPNTPPDVHQNQWGGTLGGPILRNKLTFFFSFQSTHQANGYYGTGSIDPIYPLLPTGDRSSPAWLSALGAIWGGQTSQSGITVAPNGSNINPVALKFLQFKFPNGQYILPSFPASASSGNSYSSTAQFSTVPTYNEKQYLANVEYKLTDKQTLTEKFFNAHSTTDQQAPGSVIPGFLSETTTYNQNGNLTHTWVVTPTLVNELKAGYLHISGQSGSSSQNLTASSVGLQQTADGQNGFPFLLIAFAGITAGGSGTNLNDENQYSITDSLSKTLSHHNIHAGGIAMKHQFGVTHEEAGSLFFFQFASFLIGQAASTGPLGDFLLSENFVGNPSKAFRFNDYGYYVQDDWKFRPNLTFNLGLRWDLFQQPMEKNGVLANFITSKVAEGAYGIPTTSQGYTGYAISGRYVKLHPNFPIPGGVTVQNDTAGLNTNYYNYAPRVGFAWQVEPHLSVRGGFGLFFNRPSAEVAQSELVGAPFNNRPLAVLTTAAACSLQDPFTCLNLPPQSAFPIWTPRTYTPGVAGSVSLNGAAPHVGNPYTEQWNINVQQEIARDYLFELAYQGSNGVKLLEGLAVNQSGVASAANPIRGTTQNLTLAQDGGANNADRVPYAGLGVDSNLSLTGNSASSHFNALEATLSKRFSHGFQFLSAFTWSRNFDSATVGIGGAGSSAEPPNDNTSTHHMSISGNDRKLRFTTSAVYKLPDPIKNPNNFAQNSINHVFGGWTLAATAIGQTGTPISFGLSAPTVPSSAIVSNGALTASLQPGYKIHDIETHGPARSRLKNYFNTNPVGSGSTSILAPPNTPAIAICSPIPTASSKLGCPTGTAFGNLPSNTSLRNPGQKSVDLALSKTTKIFENYNLEFRGDFFNAFNWVNFPGPDASITSPTFGQITGPTTTVDPRVIQLAAKFKF